VRRTHGEEIADEHGEEDDGRPLGGAGLIVVHLEEEGAHDDAQYHRTDDLVPELGGRPPHGYAGALDRLSTPINCYGFEHAEKKKRRRGKVPQ
jgi:hypothetical protein